MEVEVLKLSEVLKERQAATHLGVVPGQDATSTKGKSGEHEVDDLKKATKARQARQDQQRKKKEDRAREQERAAAATVLGMDAEGSFDMDAPPLAAPVLQPEFSTGTQEIFEIYQAINTPDSEVWFTPFSSHFVTTLCPPAHRRHTGPRSHTHPTRRHGCSRTTPTHTTPHHTTTPHTPHHPTPHHLAPHHTSHPYLGSSVRIADRHGRRFCEGDE